MALAEENLDRFSHYILGYKPIDDEHRAIYDALVGMWQNIPPEKIEDQIAKAKFVCDLHFRHEIELMERFNYPFIESHKAVHEYTEDLFFEFFANPTPEKREEVINNLLHHIDWYDRPFVIDMLFNQKRRKTDQSI